MDRAIKKTLNFRKAKYNVDQKTRLENSGKTGQWHSIANFLKSDGHPRKWVINDLFPEKTAEEMADNLAAHFTEITNQSEPLTRVPRCDKQGRVRYLSEPEVAGRLKKFKKPNSRVDGDLPKQVVGAAATALSCPLTAIYNQCFRSRQWPKVWKVETVVPIPKVPTPMQLGDIRPISMTRPICE